MATAAFAVTIGLACNLLYAAIQGQSPSWEFGFNFLVGFLIIQSFADAGRLRARRAAPEHPGGDRGVLHLQVGAAGLFALGSALMGWFADLSPWIDFQAAQLPVQDLSVNGDEWGHLIVSGLLWLGLPLAIGLWRVLRAEVK